MKSGTTHDHAAENRRHFSMPHYKHYPDGNAVTLYSGRVVAGS